METVPLFGDYSFRLLSWDELRPMFEEQRVKVFNRSLYFDVIASLSEAEREAGQLLNQNKGDLYRLSMGIYHQNEFIGWHFGVQGNSDKYNMRNTALFSEHRNRGVYSALLPHVLTIIKQKGFQVVYSRHHATNNAVIVPKLKAGFIISGFEITDKFGVLVHLSYYFNSLRKKAMQFRTGEIRPDDEIRRLINL